MDFFDKLGKKATEAYKITANKTGKIAKETKMKLKVGEIKTEIDDIYEEIGKKIYEKRKDNKNINLDQDIEEECIKIDVLNDEIEDISKECLELKNKKQCCKCFAKIDKEDKFCPYCGERQLEENKNIENQIEIEEISKDNEESKEESNLKHTVEVESNVELDKENKNN